MLSFNKLSKVLFGSPDNKTIESSSNLQNNLMDDFLEDTIYTFGTILYTNENNTEHIVAINNPILFCKIIKPWTGTTEKIKMKDNQGNIKWFSKNRIEDRCRSTAIAESIKHNTIYVTTTLYISEIVENDISKYYCWDGQHRRSAIKQLQYDIDCYSTIKSHFICHIYKNDNKEGIIRKFTEINKSVPVPQAILNMLEIELLRTNMTTEEINNEKIKHVADAVSMDLSKMYYEYCKPTNSPILPHFNMHNVNQDIMNYLKEFELYDIIAPELLYKITSLNETLGQKYNSIKLNKQLRKRLDKVNTHQVQCYLFIESDNFTTKLNSEE